METKPSIVLVVFLALSGCLYAQAEAESRVEVEFRRTSEEAKPFTTQSFSWKLTYRGPDRRIRFAERDVFFYIRSGDGDADEWKITYKVESNILSIGSVVTDGDQISGTVDMYWQPGLRIFEAAGKHEVWAQMHVNNETFISESISVEIVPPSDEDKRVLAALREADALEALVPYVWQSYRDDSTTKWGALIRQLAEQYPKNEYAIRMMEFLAPE